MQFPIILEKKKDKYGDTVYQAFCPIFKNAETFSPCDDKDDAIDEVKELIEDELDDLPKKELTKLFIPSKDQLKEKYPNLKVVLVSVGDDSDDEDLDDLDDLDDDNAFDEELDDDEDKDEDEYDDDDDDYDDDDD